MQSIAESDGEASHDGVCNEQLTLSDITLLRSQEVLGGDGLIPALSTVPGHEEEAASPSQLESGVYLPLFSWSDGIPWSQPS